MTLQDIERMDRATLDIADVADVLDSWPQTLHCQAQEDPRKLGFPVIVQGSRVKIPRLGFIHFMMYWMVCPAPVSTGLGCVPVSRPASVSVPLLALITRAAVFSIVA